MSERGQGLTIWCAQDHAEHDAHLGALPRRRALLWTRLVYSGSLRVAAAQGVNFHGRAATCAMHWHGVRRGAGESFGPWLLIAPPARRQGRPHFIGNRCLPIRSNRWPLTTCPECLPRRVGAEARARRAYQWAVLGMPRIRSCRHAVSSATELHALTPQRQTQRLGLSRQIS